MSYFQNLPNVYVGVDSPNDEALTFKLVKNVFRRVIVNEELEKFATQFESYYIPEGMRPEMVAYNFYGDSELDWVILISNNITDVYDQWPRDTGLLAEYVQQKYGSLDDVHHWETNEITYADAVFIKEGIEVNESFRVTLPNGVTLLKEETIYPVSNIEHETFLNEKKRLIIIPNSTLLDFFQEEFPNLVAYTKSKEVDAVGNKKSNLSSTTKLLSNSSKYRNVSGAINRFSSDTVTSYNNGPGSSTIFVDDLTS